jgi:hypothetical protein
VCVVTVPASVAQQRCVSVRCVCVRACVRACVVCACSSLVTCMCMLCRPAGIICRYSTRTGHQRHRPGLSSPLTPFFLISFPPPLNSSTTTFTTTANSFCFLSPPTPRADAKEKKERKCCHLFLSSSLLLPLIPVRETETHSKKNVKEKRKTLRVVTTCGGGYEQGSQQVARRQDLHAALQQYLASFL